MVSSVILGDLPGESWEWDSTGEIKFGRWDSRLALKKCQICAPRSSNNIMTMRPSTECCMVHSVQPILNKLDNRLFHLSATTLSASNGYLGGDDNLCLWSKMVNVLLDLSLVVHWIWPWLGRGLGRGHRVCGCVEKDQGHPMPTALRLLPHMRLELYKSAKQLHVLVIHVMKARGWSSRWTLTWDYFVKLYRSHIVYVKVRHKQ